MDYGSELQLHNGPLLRACAIGTHERVLDIGCGAGETTRAAARAAPAGSALGIDVMESMIARARALALAEGLHNIHFEQADAQIHAFPQSSFDVAISRYGTMFFSDPIAAFRNIHAALRYGGRLVMMVWQAHDLNDWSIAIDEALAPYGSSEPGMQPHFSLADPSAVEQILGAAGFTSLSFIDVHEPVYYGSSTNDALEWVRDFRFVHELLQSLDVATTARAIESLRETLARYERENGLWLDAREWIVIAERPKK